MYWSSRQSIKLANRFYNTSRTTPSGNAGQQNSDVVHQWEEKSKIPILMCWICKTMELVHITLHTDLCGLSTKTLEYSGGFPQQIFQHQPPVGIENWGVPRDLSEVLSTGRSLCYSIQCIVQTILLKERAQQQLNGRWPWSLRGLESCCMLILQCLYFSTT